MDAPVIVQCPRCHETITTTTGPGGGAVRCGHCGTHFDPRQHDTPAGPAATTAAEPETLQPGLSIAGYHLLREVGRGGMATVWAASPPDGGAPVALKMLLAHLARDADLVRRFQREVEALTQVDHPNLVRVVAQGSWHDRPWLVTDLVGDHTIRDELLGQPGGLDPERVLDIADDVLAGLAHAHAQGLVHRDIKPENLIVDAQGRIRITDFGIAQVHRSLSGDTLTQLTGTDIVMGTVAYMAPEQATATARVDHRCDLYALGVICYEALTGHRPAGRFEDPADGLEELGQRQRQAWNRFVLALLQRDPARRPADAATAQALLAELRTPEPIALDPELENEPDPAPPPRVTSDPTARRLARRGGMLAGVCGGLAAWSGVGAGWWRLLFLLGAFITGPGLVVCVAGYLVAAIALPRAHGPGPEPLNSGLLRRPRGWFFGVCEMLGERTAVPALVWRILAVVTAGAGSWIPYLIAAAILPPARIDNDPQPRPTAAPQAPAADPEPPLATGSGRRYWALLAGSLLLGLAWPLAGIAATLDPAAAQVLHVLMILALGAVGAAVSARRDARSPMSGRLGGLFTTLGLLALTCLALVPVSTDLPLADLAPWFTGAAIVILMLAIARRVYALLPIACGALLAIGCGLALQSQVAVPAEPGSLVGTIFGLPVATLRLLQDGTPLAAPQLLLVCLLAWSATTLLLSALARLLRRRDNDEASESGFSLPGTILGLGLVVSILLVGLSIGGDPASGLPLLLGAGIAGMPDPDWGVWRVLAVVVGLGLTLGALLPSGHHHSPRTPGHRRSMTFTMLLIGGFFAGLIGYAFFAHQPVEKGARSAPPIEHPPAPLFPERGSTALPEGSALRIRSPAGTWYTVPFGQTEVVADGERLYLAYEVHYEDDERRTVLTSCTSTGGKRVRIGEHADTVTTTDGWVVDLPERHGENESHDNRHGRRHAD